MKPKGLAKTLLGTSALTAAIVVSCIAPSAHAATENWTGATNGLWGLNTNWSGSTTPDSTYDLTILGPANVAGALNINIAAAAAANSISFTNTAATTLTNTTSGANQTLTLGTGGLTTGTGAVTIGSATANQNVNIALGGNQTWNVGAGGLTVTNVVSGSGFSLQKSGTGNLTLSGANTYSGGTTLSAGTLTASNASSLGTGSLTMQGGTLKVSSAVTIANNIVATSSGGTITTGAAQNFTLSGTLSGSGNLTLGGAGGGNASVQIQFAANNMTSGTITLGSGLGTPRLKNTASTSSAVDWVMNGGSTEVAGTFNFGSFGGSGNFSAFNNNSGTTLYSIGGSNNNATYSGVLSSTGTGQVLSILKIGTGSQTFSGANSFAGATSTVTVRDGSLIAGINALASANGAFGNSSSAIVLGDATTISSGTAMNPKLLTGGAFTIGRNITVGASNAALGNAGTTFTIGGNTANSSTFSGVATLNQDLQVTQVTGGTLNLTGNITSGSSGTQTLTFNNVGAVAQSTGVIGGGTGTIALTQAGAGTTTLSGANTYTGATNVNAGRLVLSSTGSINSASALTVANGAAFDVSGKATYTMGTGGTTIGIGATTAGLFDGSNTTAMTLGNALALNFSTGTLGATSYNLFDYASQTGDFSGITLTGAITGTLTNTSTDTWTGTAGGYDFSFSEVTGVLSVVPEPSAALLGGLGMLGLLRRRRVA